MRKRILALLFACYSLSGNQIPQPHPHHPNLKPPWFTGPLLTPSPITTPPGHVNIEPYVYALANTGKYDSHWKAREMETVWVFYNQSLVQFGLTSWMDFQLNPTVFYNHTKGAGMWELGDMPVGIDFQIYKNIRALDQWSPAVGISVKETIPMGKYRNLNPKKKGTDIGGEGSWQTSFFFNWGNLFYIGRKHFVTWRTSFQYTLPAPVHVKNLNFYGGGKGTDGTVYPAQLFSIDTAIEISLNQRWVFAMDFVGQWTGKSRFKGKTSTRNTVRKSAQFSLAPALEYNWSATIGVIAGAWFTIAGRNATQFSGFVSAFNYYH